MAIGIPQGLLISPILFLIYIRKIYREQGDSSLLTFIDNFIIIVISNSGRNNCRKLKQIAEHLVSLGKENAIEFDIGKTELIHFHNKHTEVQNSLEFLGTTIQPKKVVRWLGIFLDSKLTFKTHMEKKLGAAQTALYLITRLGNTQRGLSLQALR